MARPMVGGPLVWRAREVAWEIRRPLVMGIVNVTPDSFTDGGQHFSTDAAVAHGLHLLDEGADILDIGGESTRPGAQPVPAGEEWRRIGHVISEIHRKANIPLSVDTYKPEIARKAIRAGAVIVNDIHGLQDSEMVRVVANSSAGAVIMHMQGEPATMQREPRYRDVVADVRGFLARQIEAAVKQGVASEAIAVDPGFGFGKTPAHNTDLLRNLDVLTGLGRPVLVGASRKSFHETAGPTDTTRSPEASPAATAVAILRGASIVRVHDVAETVRFIRTQEGSAAGS